MSLITRCPNCGTAFRVQRDQLSARGGTVRCGKCGDMFDGVAALVVEGVERLALDPSPQLGLFDPSRRQPPAQIALEPGPAPEFLAERKPQRRLGSGTVQPARRQASSRTGRSSGRITVASVRTR